MLNGWLMALLALWALFLFGGFVRGGGSETHRIPTWMRMASSISLTLLAWGLVLVSDAVIRPYALFIALGMTCGLIGDLILAGWLSRERNVIGGIVAFGIGHILYIVGMVRFASANGLEMRWEALLVWLLIGAVGWYVVVFRGQRPLLLHWAALPYALLLAGTAGVATGLALQAGGFWGLALGAALFLLSDLVLAAELFNGLSFRSIGDVIWLTYGPGQMLIVMSVVAAGLWVG